MTAPDKPMNCLVDHGNNPCNCKISFPVAGKSMEPCTSACVGDFRNDSGREFCKAHDRWFSQCTIIQCAKEIDRLQAQVEELKEVLAHERSENMDMDKKLCRMIDHEVHLEVVNDKLAQATKLIERFLNRSKPIGDESYEEFACRWERERSGIDEESKAFLKGKP